MMQANIQIDEMDARILSAMSADSRRSYADVGNEVGLSTAAVHERVALTRAALAGAGEADEAAAGVAGGEHLLERCLADEVVVHLHGPVEPGFERVGRLVDVVAGFAVYCAAKAGLDGLTKALAIELAPEVRVNAVAPGPVEWPEDGTFDTQTRQEIINHTLLKRTGCSADIARSVLFLLAGAPYVTGQILAVDGGRSAHL